MKKKYILGGLLTLVGLFAVKTMARASYEQAPYEVIEKKAKFELRQYEPFLTATVVADGEFRDAMSNGFRKLAGYIFGGNKRKQKIAMTTPVFYDAPSSDEKARMSFMVPSNYEMSDLPEPNEEGIEFKENPAKLMAALRFSGQIDEEMWIEKRRELMEALAESEYKPVSEALFYGYDPPAVPGPLRRNEVVVEVVRR